jgi:hypothetical protein
MSAFQARTPAADEYLAEAELSILDIHELNTLPQLNYHDCFYYF